MSHKNSGTLSIYIPHALVDLAGEEAKKRGLSRNALVVEAIKAIVEDKAAADPGVGGQQKTGVQSER